VGLKALASAVSSGTTGGGGSGVVEAATGGDLTLARRGRGRGGYRWVGPVAQDPLRIV
jgi:hypothetical protein